MSAAYTTFDPANGRILRAGTSTTVAWALEQAEHVDEADEPCIILGALGDRASQYVDVQSRAMIPRPTVPDLASVPVGTRVFVDGIDRGVCDDGVVEIETAIAGPYRVRLAPPFPYQPFDTVVVIA